MPFHVQATVLIETLPAAFEMDEILWELREHSAGLNCGRWDYIFSLIKTLREDPNAIMPDRLAHTMALEPLLPAAAGHGQPVGQQGRASAVPLTC